MLPALQVDGYVRHTLHGDDRLWVEKNCYVDVVIELVHALGLEPLAAMGFCAAVDFEGDNFTFFKPDHEELRELYGVDFQEMNVWRPLLEHAQEHLGAGKFISTESDAFWLPDTSGTDYRRNHVKTTIILADLDVGSHRLGYFHNAGYHELADEDFRQLFRVGAEPDPAFLPLFAEIVRVDRLRQRAREELAAIAVRRLAVHSSRRPVTNPIERWGARFAADLPQLQERGLPHYHSWAFATTRQIGASTELLAAHLLWLTEAHESPEFTEAAAEFRRVSEGAKLFILKAARAVSSRKPLDASAMFDDMAEAWNRGHAALSSGLGSFGS
jgi:hypothetical protein